LSTNKLVDVPLLVLLLKVKSLLQVLLKQYLKVVSPIIKYSSYHNHGILVVTITISWNAMSNNLNMFIFIKNTNLVDLIETN
jgi:hypothetical protein